MGLIVTKEIYNKIILKGACLDSSRLGKSIEKFSFDHLVWGDERKILTEEQVLDVCMDFAKQHGLSIQIFDIDKLLPLCSGSGSGYGDGSGSGYGDGDGSGYGDGSGSGYGDGDGDGSGYGDGSGSGDGYGYGYGDGSGSGYGDGDGDGSGDGYGYGYGDGSLKSLIK